MDRPSQAHVADLGVAPHLLQQGFLLKHVARMAHQGEQQAALQRREGDRRWG
jgi:hypothetical protein